MNKRTVLIISSLLLAACAAPPQSETGAWRSLEREIDSAPVYGNSHGWEPLFRQMVKTGITPDQARVNCRRAARFGPTRRKIRELMEENTSRNELQNALNLAHADAMERRRTSASVQGYQHLRGDFSARGLQWNILAKEIAAPPLHGEPLKYRRIYNKLCNLGFSARSARLNVRRAARFGPTFGEMAAIIKKHEADGSKAVQAALNARHVEALNDRWDDDIALMGYTHFEFGAETELAKVIEKEARGETNAMAPTLEAPKDDEDADEAETETDDPTGEDADLDDPDAELDDPDLLELDDEPDLEDDPDLMDPFDDEAELEDGEDDGLGLDDGELDDGELDDGELDDGAGDVLPDEGPDEGPDDAPGDVEGDDGGDGGDGDGG